jgi:hypothetical protein
MQWTQKAAPLICDVSPQIGTSENEQRIEIFKRDPWLRLGQRAEYRKLASTVEKPSASIRIDANVTVVAIEKKKDKDLCPD